jgi:putative ABC transport system permease protein
MGKVIADIRQALRLLRRRPGFTTAVAITLALGIGANTAIFSVINTVLLRPLPHPNPERLVMVWGTQNVDPNRFPNPAEIRAMKNWWVTSNTFARWAERQGPFEALAGYHEMKFGLSGGGQPERITGAFVTSGFFPMLGVQPFLGRTFLPEEDHPGASPVVILSHRLWTQRYGAAPGILGSKIPIDGVPYAAIGVLPPSFDPVLPNLSRDTDVWVPMARDVRPGRDWSIFTVGARLKPGISLAQAQAEQSSFARSLHAENPRRYQLTGVNLVPMSEEMSHSIRPALLVLWGASGLVLLIAAVNMANLLLARASARQRETSIRAVLGASRWQLARETLVEGSILALLGGALGMLAARWGVSLLLAAVPEGLLPRSSEITVDTRVLLLGLLLSLASGLLAAALPAWNVSRCSVRNELNEALKESGRSSSSGRTRRLRGLLVVSEIALTLLLLAGAGLLLRSFVRLTGVDPGFRPERVLTVGMALPEAKYRAPASQSAFADRVLQRVQGLPAVQVAAVINSLPIKSQVWLSLSGVEIEGQPKDAAGASLYFRSVSLDYFRAMSISLRRGRLFTTADSAKDTILVNEAMVRRYWPDAAAGSTEPLGRRINIEDKWREIVGVVSDIKHDSLDADTSPEVYAPFRAVPSQWMTLVVRSAGDPSKLISAVQAAVWAVDRDQPLQDIQTLEQVVYDSVATPRFRTLLLGIFAVLALALATVGIYGVIAYAVTERTREIGIRMALGAARTDVLRMVVREGMMLGAIGVVIGLAAAFATTRILTSFLFGIQPADPLTLAAVSLLTILIAATASYVPARRATKVDPLVVLRWE